MAALAAAFCLATERRAALFWLLAGGGAGLYLFGMDVLYDLQHGIWGKGGNGPPPCPPRLMSQFHFDPATGLDPMREEVPAAG